MFLPDYELHEWASNGGIEPYDPGCVNPASIDLRWSGRVRVAKPSGWGGVDTYDFKVLYPNTLYLLDTLEYIKIPPDCIGWLALKSSSGRRGLEHLHAGLFDPGFHGTATLEIEVRAPWDVEIEKRQKIIQLALARLEGLPTKTYEQTGRYHGQKEPTEAK